MKFDPDKHHRRSIRLKDYDYSSPGAYFVTICAQNREFMFGEISFGEMILNDAGKMIETTWNELPQNYPGVAIDEFIIMPNHFHGIILLTGKNVDIASERGNHGGIAPTNSAETVRAMPLCSPNNIEHSLSLPDVVHRFKSLTTARYRQGVVEYSWRTFPGRLWQRNYYEHILRDEDELNQIREYIRTNPQNWDIDIENPNFRET